MGINQQNINTDIIYSNKYHNMNISNPVLNIKSVSNIKNIMVNDKSIIEPHTVIKCCNGNSQCISSHILNNENIVNTTNNKQHVLNIFNDTDNNTPSITMLLGNNTSNNTGNNSNNNDDINAIINIENIEQPIKPKYNILIIDDNVTNTNILKCLIETLGNYTVSMLSNPLLATNEILTAKYKIILLDLKMPKKSGFDILDELNEYNFFVDGKYAQCSIIIITALISTDTKQRLRLYPNINILYKPLDPNELKYELARTIIKMNMLHDEEIYTSS